MIGGDVRLAHLRVELISNPSDAPMTTGSSVKTTSSLLASISLLVKAGLATDPFILIETLKTGVLQCLIVAAFMFFLTYGAFEIFLDSWNPGEACTYSAIWTQAIHAGSAWIPLFLIAISYIAALSFCFLDVVDCLSALVGWLWPALSDRVSDPWLLQYAAAFVVVLPSLWGTGFRSFRWVAWVSNFCELMALASVAIYFFRHAFDGGRYAAASQVVLFSFDLDSFHAALRDFNICMFVHPVIPLLVGEMHNPTRSRVKKMVLLSLLFIGIFSYVVPCISYLMFVEEEVVSCFFLYLDPDRSPEVIVGTVCMIVIALCSNMYFAYIVCQAILAMFHVDVSEESATLPRLFATSVSVLISICLNFAGDLVFALFYEISSLAFALLGYFLPALFFLTEFKFKSLKWGFFSLFVFACGAFLTILGIVSAVQEMMAM
jgi:hypothetical protein